MAAETTSEDVKLAASFKDASKLGIDQKSGIPRKVKGTLTWRLELKRTNDGFWISAFFKGASKKKISIKAEFTLLCAGQEPLNKTEKKDSDCTKKSTEYEVCAMFTECETENHFEKGSDLRFEVELTIVMENSSKKSSVKPKPEAKQEPTKENDKIVGSESMMLDQLTSKLFLKASEGARIISNEIINDLLDIANRFDVPEVKTKCEQFLLEDLKKALKEKMETAEKYELDCLQAVKSADDALANSLEKLAIK
ncbi:MATH domain-containing protein [Caenorhabditis elegans]|uniref:MATH domain-containing protein n=1 Tax=Caenorhabditis elegans TaxID=6239 RepID=P91544_CAEEL|nr:MATH domain-containing protein [Caenorhabditis elegans]CCD63693.1 MATH domain-containing protein [Caenorhabditis elegans]|eukprot:NP_494029.1 Uncharacterized protein CELE_ZC204.12 [Caenorhabditis elegans]